MAERRPLVLLNGDLQELPSGDTLPGAGSLQNNYTATAAPAIGNDNTEGYAVGSIWADITNDKAYIALDVTTGAAVWTEITQTGGGTSGPQNNFEATVDPVVGDDNVDGYSIGSLWINTTTDTAYICVDVSTGAAVWNQIDGSSGSGASDFLSLTDTPTTYSGKAENFLKVNSAETAIEYTPIQSGITQAGTLTYENTVISDTITGTTWNPSFNFSAAGTYIVIVAGQAGLTTSSRIITIDSIGTLDFGVLAKYENNEFEAITIAYVKVPTSGNQTLNLSNPTDIYRATVSAWRITNTLTETGNFKINIFEGQNTRSFISQKDGAAIAIALSRGSADPFTGLATSDLAPTLLETGNDFYIQAMSQTGFTGGEILNIDSSSIGILSNEDRALTVTMEILPDTATKSVVNLSQNQRIVTTNKNVDESDLAGNTVNLVNSNTLTTITINSGLSNSEPVTFIRLDADVTFAAGLGVNLYSAAGNLTIANQYGAATLIPDKSISDTYYLIGDIA